MGDSCWKGGRSQAESLPICRLSLCSSYNEYVLCLPDARLNVLRCRVSAQHEPQHGQHAFEQYDPRKSTECRTRQINMLTEGSLQTVGHAFVPALLRAALITYKSMRVPA